MAAPDPSTLDETATRLGRHVWVETALFQTLGAWVPHVPEPEPKALLATHAHHHAWHAELWRERLPVVAGRDPDAVVRAPDGFEAVVAALGEADGPGSTVEKLVGVYRVVLPRLIAGYRRELAASSPVADGPVVRALGLVLHDEVADWCAGEALLQSLLDGDAEVRRAAAAQERVEGAIVAAARVAAGQRA